MVDRPGASPGPNVEVVSLGGLTWAYVERPTVIETDYLRDTYGLHPVHLAGCLARHQQPRLVHQPAYLLVVLGVPVHNRLGRGTSSGELSVFLGSDYVVTIHHGEVRAAARLFRDCQGDEARRAEVVGHGPAYLLYVLADRLAGHWLQVVEALADSVHSSEEALLTEDDPEPIREISYLRREVAALRRIAPTQQAVLGGLAGPGNAPRLADQGMAVYWRDLAERMDQIVAVLEGCDEAIVGLSATAGSLAARRAGDAARLTAAVATAFLPAIALAVLFAANFKSLPLADDPYAFEYLLAAMALLVVTTLLVLRRSRRL